MWGGCGVVDLREGRGKAFDLGDHVLEDEGVEAREAGVDLRWWGWGGGGGWEGGGHVDE